MAWGARVEPDDEGDQYQTHNDAAEESLYDHGRLLSGAVVRPRGVCGDHPHPPREGGRTLRGRVGSAFDLRRVVCELISTVYNKTITIDALFFCASCAPLRDHHLRGSGGIRRSRSV